MHQPSGAIVPSTVLHEEGASNSAQLSQRWSPFGVSWYFTDFCGVFACAGVDAPMIAAAPVTAPAAPAAMVKTPRREILEYDIAAVLSCWTNEHFKDGRSGAPAR
jgi:hypothetical protein